jgi:hypothetical protein
MARQFLKAFGSEQKLTLVEILDLDEDGDGDEEFNKWETDFIRSQFKQSPDYRSSRNKLAEESEY